MKLQPAQSQLLIAQFRQIHEALIMIEQRKTLATTEIQAAPALIAAAALLAFLLGWLLCAVAALCGF